MQLRKPPLVALTFKLSKYNVDDVALGVCKTGAEEAGVTEVRTSLSEKKFEVWREIKVRNMIKLLCRNLCLVGAMRQPGGSASTSPFPMHSAQRWRSGLSDSWRVSTASWDCR